MQEIQDSIKSTSSSQPLEELKKMDLDSETIQKVQNSLQEDAKSKVTQIQGEYYETYD